MHAHAHRCTHIHRCTPTQVYTQVHAHAPNIFDRKYNRDVKETFRVYAGTIP